MRDETERELTLDEWMDKLPSCHLANKQLADIRRQLAARDKTIEELFVACEDLIDMAEPPEPNCSCHISAPCRDCVDYGGLREAIASARATLGKTEAKP